MIFLISTVLYCQDYGSIINKYKVLPLNLENVANAIIEFEIINPDTVFLQTIKESGWHKNKTEYKSVLANEFQNLFGMRKARKRYTTCLDVTYKGYASYSHWIYSVLDYKYWQDYKKPDTNESYQSFLIRRGYAANTKAYVKLFNYKLPENIKRIFQNAKCKKLFSDISDNNVDTTWISVVYSKTYNQRSIEKRYNLAGKNNYKTKTTGYNICRWNYRIPSFFRNRYDKKYRYNILQNTCIYSKIRYRNQRYFQTEIFIS